MCTLIALHRCVPGAYLVVAANRDEKLGRPADPPALRATPNGPVVAPRDRFAGGTWLGINPSGVFAAVTNRAGSLADPTRRSRGLLVLDALGATRARDAADALSNLPQDAYNPFNLLVADPDSAFAVGYLGRPRVLELAPGIHVIGNGDVGESENPKLERVRDRVFGMGRHSASALLESLAELCRSHESSGDPLSSVCVHAPGYGTRSSTLLWLGESGAILRHAEGAPCATDYEDLTPLLDRLGRTTELGSGELAARGAS